MEMDGIAAEIFDEHELEEAVRSTEKNDDISQLNVSDFVNPSEEIFAPAISQEEPEEEEETEAPDADTEESAKHELTEINETGQDDNFDGTESTTTEIASIPAVQVRSLAELCDTADEVEQEDTGDKDNNAQVCQNVAKIDEPNNVPVAKVRTSERKRKLKRPKLEYDSEDDFEVNLSSDEEWNPAEENEADPDDPDFEYHSKRRRSPSDLRRSVGQRKRKPNASTSSNRSRPMRFTPACKKECIKLHPRPTPPALQPVDGKTPLLIIKPLQIPESFLQRTKSFVIKQQGQARIKVVPKFGRVQTDNPNEGTMRSTSISALSHSTVRKVNSQTCANCNVHFSKLTPKVTHLRLDGERLSASDAFKKILQLQLPKHRILPNIHMDESVGLCSPCGSLIIKIYGAVCDFTQKRSPRSYFHQISVKTLRNSYSASTNGSMHDMKPHISRPGTRNVKTSTDPPATCDKSTNYPVEDLKSYHPVVPEMPAKIEDYSRVSALCDICGAGLTKESGLKTHLLLTHSISTEQKSRDFVCGVCGKAYFFQYLLKNHMSVHSNEKPFSCPKENCTATFKSRASLRTHRIEVHELREQGQSFDCKFCDKKYLRPRDLRDHTMARHSDQPQFECPYCHKFFQRKKNVRTHRCPNRPNSAGIKHDVLKDVTKSENENQSLIPINTHEDLLLVKNNSSPKHSSPELGFTSEIVQALATIQEEYDTPEAVEHIEIHDNLSRPVQYIPQPQASQQDIVHTPSEFRPQAQHQHVISSGTVQYLQPVSYSQHQQQQLQVNHPQVHQYRIVGHPTLEGETLGVYETVNFLDILNDTRQQQPATTATTYQSFSK